MTLELYARRKGWPLESVTVELSHERVHAQDCEDCEKPEQGFIELIRRYIVVTGPLSNEQKERLLEIAKRCPVHKTLSSTLRIVDEMDIVGPPGSSPRAATM